MFRTSRQGRDEKNVQRGERDVRTGSARGLADEKQDSGEQDISGLALIVAGIFKGTPPGAEPTPSGMIHGMAFFWTFIPLPTAFALTALRLQVERGWGAHAVYSAAMPSVVFGLMVIYGVLGSDPGDPLFPVGGILNRVLIALAFGWVTITAARLFKYTGGRAR